MRATALGVGGTAAIAGVIAAAARTWSRSTRVLVDRLEPLQFERRPRDWSVVRPEEYAVLPPPVARYFAFALAREQRRIERARVRQRGTMRAGPAARWKAFTADEEFATAPAGFVWNGKLRLLPLLSIRIRDAYVAGEGRSEGAIGGILPLPAQRATPAVAEASLVRYLFEAVWFPTALLPRGGVRWEQTGDRFARAVLTDRGLRVHFDVEFGQHGEIVSGTTLRHRAVGGRLVPTTWTGRYSAYERIDGMMIPTRAEVSWAPPGGEFAVWRGEITDIRFRYAIDPPPVLANRAGREAGA